MGGSNRGLVRRAGSLRLSLLVSLGIFPVACGGTALTTSDGTAGTGGAIDPGGSGPITGDAGLAGVSGSITHGGSAGTAGVGGTTNRVPVCDSPVEDPVTHLVTCANGILHRPAATKCTLPPEITGGAAGTSGAGGASADIGEGGFDECATDADCPGKLSFCERGPAYPGAPPSTASCQAGCLQDSDCDHGICLCDGSAHGGTCRSSQCKVDADCGVGFFCSPVEPICGGSAGFQCLKATDQCWTSADCAHHSPCISDSVTGRSCFEGACGRPFLVAETARLAEVTARRDWLAADVKPDLLGLSALERAELAAHWARLGQMEHASIAAFARFNLQLLSLGAPADLLEGCNRALVDETRHARLCFALASQYGGMPVGPGPLAVHDCFEGTDLASVMKLVLSEGCIGETVAALDAMEQAATASDPVVRDVLRGIARDEQNHAELAYRFMRWALERSSAELRSEMAREAEARLSAFERSADGVQFIAAREVARPLLEALFVTDAIGTQSGA
jgi:hypothetical protein